MSLFALKASIPRSKGPRGQKGRKIRDCDKGLANKLVNTIAAACTTMVLEGGCKSTSYLIAEVGAVVCPSFDQAATTGIHHWSLDPLIGARVYGYVPCWR